MVAVSARPHAWAWRGTRRRFTGGVLLPSSLLRTVFKGRPGRSPQNREAVSPDFNSRWTRTDTFAVQGRILVPEFGVGLRRPVRAGRLGPLTLSNATSAKLKNVAKPGSAGQIRRFRARPAPPRPSGSDGRPNLRNGASASDRSGEPRPGGSGVAVDCRDRDDERRRGGRRARRRPRLRDSRSTGGHRAGVTDC